ncbi:MAG: DUF3822 family protein [Duncaniella sp.]|nr:DUF3822 family protein [Duncaniella sp.]
MTLDRDLIENTALYDMLVRIGDESVDVVVYSAMSDGSLTYRSYAVAEKMGLVRALEEVVYDNPLMLREFRRVYMLIDTPRYAMMPAGLDEAAIATAYTAMYPDVSRNAVRHALTGTRNAVVAYSAEPELEGFIGRTFTGATLLPHMAPLVRYLASKAGRGNTRRMICNLRRNSMDVVVLDGSNLLQGNTFRFRNEADAVYYILASRVANGLDPLADELLLAGDTGVRDRITPLLRTYVARVMPAIFPPQMFSAGKDAMQAPFDLIVTPLCE